MDEIKQGDLFGHIKVDPDFNKWLYMCIKCHQYKDKKHYHILPTGEVKRECKSCKSIKKKLMNRLRQQHPMPTNPDYKCPICLRNKNDLLKLGYKDTTVMTWVLDHDHVTGKFRGYICKHCNTGIGALADDQGRIGRALEYLQGGF
tara:strand:+ start:1325 stop:1762 length:438 start_codon:yes stop_codon:yes gene_type:complete